MTAEAGSQGARWYLAQSKPNEQSIAERHLHRQCFEVFAPQHAQTRRTRGGMIRVMRPLFPGYLFVRADPAQGAWRAINGTQGIAKLVQFGSGGPASVPDALIAGLMSRCDSPDVVQPKPLKTGERVRMLSGPFADFLATVERISPGQRVWVLLDFMGRQTRAFARRGEVATV